MKEGVDNKSYTPLILTNFIHILKEDVNHMIYVHLLQNL